MMTNQFPDEYINLAAFCPQTQVLGPGFRAAIWVQGCKLNCPGCIAQDWIPLRGGFQIEINTLAERLIHLKHLDGITISGGEPFLQARQLVRLIKRVRNHRPIDVICFTGYTLEQILNWASSTGAELLLDQVDLLIDGPYQSEANNGIGLRGSSNQRFHHLTSKLSNFDFATWPRSLEVFWGNGETLIVGIPPKNVRRLFDMVITNSLYDKVGAI